jgi:aminomethyltransferase
MLLEPLRTPLYDLHLGLQAQMNDVRGWRMPMTYGNTKVEYQAVVDTAGIADVSNQVKIEVAGEGAATYLQKLTTTDLAGMSAGKAHKTLLCRRDGSVVDRVTILQLPDRFLLIGSSGVAPTLYQWLQQYLIPDVTLTNLTHSLAIMALCGPSAFDLLENRIQSPFITLAPLQFVVVMLGSVPATILSLGDAIQPRYNLFCAAADASTIWHWLAPTPLESPPLAYGQSVAEVLRLERGEPMLGSEIMPDTNPFEAGLGGSVDFSKTEFVSRQGLKRCLKLGLDRQMVGIRGCDQRDVLRKGQSLFSNGRQVGELTSAVYSPRLHTHIALARVDIDFVAPETSLDVRLADRRFSVVVGQLPFQL